MPSTIRCTETRTLTVKEIHQVVENKHSDIRRLED